MENVPSFNQLIQESIINNWDLDALRKTAYSVRE